MILRRRARTAPRPVTSTDAGNADNAQEAITPGNDDGVPGANAQRCIHTNCLNCKYENEVHLSGALFCDSRFGFLEIRCDVCHQVELHAFRVHLVSEPLASLTLERG